MTINAAKWCVKLLYSVWLCLSSCPFNYHHADAAVKMSDRTNHVWFALT